MIKRKFINNYKWLILFFFSLLFLIISIRVKQNPDIYLDHQLYEFIKNIESDSLTTFFQALTSLISIPIIFIICLVTVLISKHYKRIKYCIFIIINFILIVGLNLTLKLIYARPRPVEPLIKEFGYSFPSGHAMVSMAFYGLFIYLLLHTKLNKYAKYLLSTFLLLIILLIGFSRIYLNVHYVSDVIAGFSISIIYLLFYTKFMKSYLKDIRKQKLYMSFYHALEGIKTGYKLERNVRIHCIVIIFTLMFSYILKISKEELLICLLLFGLVISLEYVNTAIEKTVDLVTLEYNEKAKIAKDTSAAAVFISAFIALTIGLIIFIPKIFF